MRRALIIIGLCALTAVALTVWAQAPADLSDTMKNVNSTNQSLQKNIQANMPAAAAADAEKLQKLFGDASAFFKSKKIEKAAGWASDASKTAGEAAKAGKAKDSEALKAAATKVGEACKSCHQVYREKAADGSFKLKTQ